MSEPASATEHSTGASGLSDTTMHLAYAEASLMLVECLMLTMIDARVLSKEELIDAVETALATKRDQVRTQVHPEIASIAAGVLSRIANSLAAAGRGEPKGV